MISALQNRDRELSLRQYPAGSTLPSRQVVGRSSDRSQSSKSLLAFRFTLCRRCTYSHDFNEGYSWSVGEPLHVVMRPFAGSRYERIIRRIEILFFGIDAPASYLRWQYGGASMAWLGGRT